MRSKAIQASATSSCSDSMGLSISTLGDLKENGCVLTFYCEAVSCGRMLGLDLDKAIALWGEDLRYIGFRWPVKCSACGSKTIGVRVSPGSYRDQVARDDARNAKT